MQLSHYEKRKRFRPSEFRSALRISINWRFSTSVQTDINFCHKYSAERIIGNFWSVITDLKYSEYKQIGCLFVELWQWWWGRCVSFTLFKSKYYSLSPPIEITLFFVMMRMAKKKCNHGKIPKWDLHSFIKRSLRYACKSIQIF